MIILLGMEWIGTLLGIICVVLIARKDITGFYYGLVADVLLIPPSLYAELYGFCVLLTIYAVLNVYGIMYWSKD